MAKRKLTYQQLLKKNKALEAKIEELNKEIEDLDFTSSMNQFDVTAYENIEEMQYKRSRDINEKKKKGADAGNTQKKSIADQRRDKIKCYLNDHPNPTYKAAWSLATFLIQTLDLQVSEKTINQDLIKLNLEKR